MFGVPVRERNPKGGVKVRSTAKEPRGTCVFCSAPATSRDHIPPKGFFLPPLRENLVTVPACTSCNNGASECDDRFRSFVSMRVGAGNPQKLDLWRSKVLPGIRRNRKEFRRLIRSMRDVEVYTQGGIYLGVATQCAFEAEPHDNGIRRTVRGLYWHEFGEALPREIPIEVLIQGPNWKAALSSLLPMMQVRAIGSPETFQYAFGRVADVPTASVWLFNFFAGHLVAAMTGEAASSSDHTALATPAQSNAPSRLLFRDALGRPRSE
jgi:hypothetical protein